MSDYIEDRIRKLEDQTQAIVDELKVLDQFTTDIVEAQTKRNDRTADGADKIKDLQFSVEKLFRLNNTTEYSLREIWKAIAKIQYKQNKVDCAKDHIDQSTEEFVKVVRCGKCAWRNSLNNWCMNKKGLNREVLLGEYCSEGKIE